MSNPGMYSSGGFAPNANLYRSAGDNDLYRSYEKFAGGAVDPRMYASPGGTALDPRLYASPGGASGQLPPRPSAAQQFVKNFGAFGPHGQPKGVGVGIRVEFNDARELVVAKVNDGGSAARDGTIRAGDVLLSVGQLAVAGKTLIQLRPFMIGPRGSTVALTLQRKHPGSTDTSSYTVDLVRGDNLYWLEAENQSTAAKLEVFRKQNSEVEVEMNNMRSILAQSQARAKMSEGEVQTMQSRYRQMENAIAKCNGDILEERQQSEAIREDLAKITNETQHRAQIRQYHEQLTRVEVQLGQVMASLAGEHEDSCKLVTQLDQEHMIAEVVSEKIRKHEGFVAESSDNHSNVKDIMEQRRLELKALQEQIAEAEAEYKSMDGDLEEADADVVHQSLTAAQVRTIFWFSFCIAMFDLRSLSHGNLLWRCTRSSCTESASRVVPARTSGEISRDGSWTHEIYLVCSVPLTFSAVGGGSEPIAYTTLTRIGCQTYVWVGCLRASVCMRGQSFFVITTAEADSEHKLVLSKAQRLVEKKELIRAVSDKRQLASNGLQRSVTIRSILCYLPCCENAQGPNDFCRMP